MRIHKDIPIPQKQITVKYPFDDMFVGDSLTKQTKQARGAAHAYGSRHGKKFVSRLDRKTGLYTIWRSK